MIVKLIFLILFVWFGMRIYKTLQSKKTEKISPLEHKDMVSCETCGIHVPVDEAIKKGEKYFCGPGHLP